MASVFPFLPLSAGWNTDPVLGMQDEEWKPDDSGNTCPALPIHAFT